MRTQMIAKERGAFRLDQFARSANARAHEMGTAAEIWEQSGGTITAFCDFVGSGGTFAGLKRGLTARNPAVRGYVVEPVGAAVLAGQSIVQAQHKIQGGGYARRDLPLLADVGVDGYVQVSDNEAIAAARALAIEEGIFGGFSSGANLAAALNLLRGKEKGGTLAVLICDSGLKYLSTDLWPSFVRD